MNKKNKILIVDDSPYVVLLIRDFIVDEGFKPLIANNGPEALIIAETQLPDLILLDINMPKMDGFETCVHLKNNIRTANIPVIFISANTNKLDKVKAFESGAVDYVNKPIEFTELFARMRTHLKINQLQNDLVELNEQLINRANELEKANVFLQESENQFRLVFEESNDAIVWANPIDGIIFRCNTAAEKLFERSRSEIIGQHQSILHPPDKLDFYKAVFNNVVENNIKNTEAEIYTKSGQIKNVEIFFSEINIGDFVIAQGIFEDITERKQIERKILAAIINTEEKERKKFAQEIHDGLGPLLSTGKIFLNNIRNAKDIKIKERSIDKISEIFDEALAGIKEISNNISPHILRNFGLGIAVEAFIDKCKPATDINFILHNHLSGRFADFIEVTSYRIITELINNSLKYSESDTIEISFVLSENTMFLNYSDNGKGFDYDNEKQKLSGFGLFNIANRVKSLNGNFIFESNPGKGVKAEIQFPVNTNMFRC